MTSFILASGSPRRRELLGQLGLSFDVVAAELDESVRPAELPKVYVERLAREKAMAVHARRPGSIVLAADTSVVVDDVILGKPGADAREGAAMLRSLSGRSSAWNTCAAFATYLAFFGWSGPMACQRRPAQLESASCLSRSSWA